MSITATPRNNASVSFEADDNADYYRNYRPGGYDISAEFAALAEAYFTSVLGQTKDSEAGIITEKITDNYQKFGMTGERKVWIDGVVKTECAAFLYCTAQQLSYDASTSANGEPKVKGISMSADPHPYTQTVKKITTDDAPTATFSGWHSTSAEWIE
ncbi:MAG: hypothetical protein Q4C04_04440 [Clostridia bacterium]|nr:hypothetical protein [Clostridia bacterium]